MALYSLTSITEADIVISTICCSGLPGWVGGVAIFVLNLREGHYRNNKYISKFMIETIGATLTALFIVPLVGDFIESQAFKIGLAFGIGVCWVNILKIVRIKITNSVEVALGEKLPGDNR